MLSHNFLTKAKFYIADLLKIWFSNKKLTFLATIIARLVSNQMITLHKKWSFPVRIFSVNMTKSLVENFIFCAVLSSLLKCELPTTRSWVTANASMRLYQCFLNHSHNDYLYLHNFYLHDHWNCRISLGSLLHSPYIQVLCSRS